MSINDSPLPRIFNSTVKGQWVVAISLEAVQPICLGNREFSCVCFFNHRSSLSQSTIKIWIHKRPFIITRLRTSCYKNVYAVVTSYCEYIIVYVVLSLYRRVTHQCVIDNITRHVVLRNIYSRFSSNSEANASGHGQLDCHKSSLWHSNDKGFKTPFKFSSSATESV